MCSATFWNFNPTLWLPLHAPEVHNNCSTPLQGNYNGFAQIYVSGTGTYNFTGSTLRFGDGVSSKTGCCGYGFSIWTNNAVLGNVVVNNPPAASNRMVRLYGPVNIGGNLTINSGASNIFQLDGMYSYIQGDSSWHWEATWSITEPLQEVLRKHPDPDGTGPRLFPVRAHTAFSALTLNSTSVSSPVSTFRYPWQKWQSYINCAVHWELRILSTYPG